MPKFEMDDTVLEYFIERNKNKNFIDRIINREKYPVIENPDGSYSTHLMSWSTVDGKPIVYPLIIQNPKTGGLKQLSDPEAIDYALKNNEYIPFDKPEDADWFSSNYKRYWELPSYKGKKLTKGQKIE